MRLIDLDDAIEAVKIEVRDNISCPHTVSYVLENRPKVKAIPIDWIDEYLDVIQYKEGITAKDIMVIEDMIYKWEKENEQ